MPLWLIITLVMLCGAGVVNGIVTMQKKKRTRLEKQLTRKREGAEAQRWLHQVCHDIGHTFGLQRTTVGDTVYWRSQQKVGPGQYVQIDLGDHYLELRFTAGRTMSLRILTSDVVPIGPKLRDVVKAGIIAKLEQLMEDNDLEYRVT